MKKLLLLSLCMLLLCFTEVYAQSRAVSGTVTAQEDKQPIPGVSVRVKGTQVGTVTDGNGKYTINVPNGTRALEFSFIGYTTQEVAIASSNSINVVLAPTSSALSEVVVTGYGTQTKSVTTGSAAQVSSRDLEDKSFPSFDQGLQGRVAGLQSSGGNGQPGALQQIRIRGIGSVTAGAAPLFVVDGIPINSGDLSRNTTSSTALAGINPNDIERIDVLKDAATASIYGSRGANGVIVITTKSGKAGKTKLRFDVEYGKIKASRLPEAGRPLTTDEWRTLTGEGLLNNPDYVDAYGLTPGNVNAFVDENFGTGTGVSTNWIDLVTRTGTQQQYNLSADGGNENTQFHISGGYFKQQGTVIASDFNRYSTNIDLKHKVNNKLSFSSSFIIGVNGQNTPSNGGAFSNPVGSAYFLPPYIAPNNADGSYNIDPSTFPSSNFNPLALAELNKQKLHQQKLIGSLSGEYKILNNLKFTSRIGVDYNNLEEDTYWNPTYGDGTGYNGYASRYYTRYFNWVATNLLDYRLDLNNDNVWVANIKAGYEAQKSQYYDISSTNTNLPANIKVNVPSAGASPLESGGSNSDYSIASILALGDISYKGKYVLSGSFRRDGSSRFGSENRYGNFGSIGASWNAHEEEFMKNVTWITTLKLRANYGSLGNADIGNYSWRRLYSYGNNYLGRGGSRPTSVGNANLTWETNKTADIGLDASLFNSRLGFKFDWYNRQSDNLLLDQPLSTTTGLSTYTNNIGSMRNRGYEVTLSGTPLIINDFRWDASFSISHNTNRILSLVNNKDQISGAFIRRVGYDFQTFYLREWAGVNPANGAPQWYTDASHTNITNNYNAAKQNTLGSASPKYFGSFTSTFSYKGFSLDGLLYYNFGNYIQDTWALYLQGDGYDTGDNHMASQLARWQKPGDITNVPAFIYDNPTSSSQSSSRFLYKGDYLRLRELTLSYNFSKTLLQKVKLSSLKLYVRGTNLWTWVRDENLPYDPETFITGQTNLDVYVPKYYSIGLNVGF